MEAQLSCPVCKEVPREGDLYQCIKGHLICEKCFEGISQQQQQQQLGQPRQRSFRGAWLTPQQQPARMLERMVIENGLNVPDEEVRERYEENPRYDKQAKCPTCRGRFMFMDDGKPQRALLANQLIESVVLECKNADKGCAEKKVRKALVSHEETCGFNKVACRYKDLGCDFSQMSRDIPDHERQCMHRFVDCRNSKYGCKFNGEFDAEASHIANNACDHQKIGQKFEEIERRLHDLTVKLNDLMQGGTSGSRRPVNRNGHPFRSWDLEEQLGAIRRGQL